MHGQKTKELTCQIFRDINLHSHPLNINITPSIRACEINEEVKYMVKAYIINMIIKFSINTTSINSVDKKWHYKQMLAMWQSIFWEHEFNCTLLLERYQKIDLNDL